MFPGIVEECATLVAMVKDQENVHFTFKCSFVSELKIDQSVSHNGVCLTVVSLTDEYLYRDGHEGNAGTVPILACCRWEMK